MSWLITINDTHKTDGQVENSELETVAEVSGTENDYKIEYDEQSEEMKGCHTTVHVTDGCCVHITRKGSYSTELMMDKGKRSQCCYITPVGQISMGVFTSRVISEFTEKNIKLDFTYTLDFNNELISRNRVRIAAANKEAE
ncbi:MAG: DUF1934 domain-containing protein [Clostridia bacterium]|nr:DUF1934 domain-containing protein [Clostridia bacterium]